MSRGLFSLAGTLSSLNFLQACPRVGIPVEFVNMGLADNLDNKELRANRPYFHFRSPIFKRFGVQKYARFVICVFKQEKQISTFMVFASDVQNGSTIYCVVELIFSIWARKFNFFLRKAFV